MRHFVSFVQHLLILIIASIIVVLLAQHAFKDSFCVNLNGKVSVAEAAGIVNMGEEANEETLAEFSQRLFGKGTSITINFPQPVLHFINSTEVGGFLAKCLHYQLFIFLLSGVLCLVCGVGFPFRIGRGKTLGSISDSLVGADPTNIYSKTYQDFSGKWITEDRYAGDNKSLVVWLILCVLYFFLIIIWGLLIVPIIVIDFVIALFSITIKLIISKKDNSSRKADTAVQTVAKSALPAEPVIQAQAPVIQTVLTNQSLFDYEFLINGEVLKLPIYTDVLARMNYKAIEKPLDGGSTIEAFVLYMKDFMCLNVKTGVQILPNAMTSCFDDYDRTYDYYRYYGTDLIKFNQLTFSHTLNAKINYEFDFFKGIKPNTSTADDVYNAFGKPSYVSLENRQYIYLETPDAVADKSNPDVQESGFVRFTFDDNDILTEITISHKVR